MNLHKKLVDGEERILSGMSLVGENNNNGLLFAPTCTTCFNENKFIQMLKKNVPANGLISALTALASTLFFHQRCIIMDTIIRNPTKFSPKHNYSVPQTMTLMSYGFHNP
jgi:hypothetical protein